MLIILDRDGVINQFEGGYICSTDEWHPIPGSIEAIAELSKAGHLVAVATNQSGIGRGYYDHETLNAMHQRLRHLVAQLDGRIELIAYCPHHPDEGCSCRKPETGLLEAIRTGLNVSTETPTFMVGDSLKDLQAGDTAGCDLVLVRTGNGKDTELKILDSDLANKVTVVDDLAMFSRQFLAKNPIGNHHEYLFDSDPSQER